MHSADGHRFLWFVLDLSLLLLLFTFSWLWGFSAGFQTFDIRHCILIFFFIKFFSFPLPSFFSSFSLLTLLSLHCTLPCLAGRGTQVTLGGRMLCNFSDPGFSPSFEAACFPLLRAGAPRTPLTGLTVHNTDALHGMVVGFQSFWAIAKALPKV